MNRYKNKLVITLALCMLVLAGCANTTSTDIPNVDSASPDNVTDHEATVTDEGEIILYGDTTDDATSDAAADDTAGKAADDAGTAAANLALKDFFADHNMKVGTCLSPGMVSNPAASELILSQFSSVTLENAMKPDFIISKKKSIDAGTIAVEFNSDMIKMLDFAKENGLAVRGHTLIWHQQTPDWIFYEDFDKSKELASREVMLTRMEDYIRQVFEGLTEKGYIDMFYAYDVVNEAYMEDGSMRDSLWKDTIGDDYLLQAFTFADKYAPEHIDLFYNDYNEQFKMGRLAKLADELVADDGRRLIDGIGLQAHLYTQDDLNKYMMAVSKIGSSGVKLEITELDVGLGSYQNVLKAEDDNLKAQGKFYYQLVEGLLKKADAGEINMDSLTFWGFTDSMSWRKESSPLIYDGSFEPKYAYYGAIQMKDKAGF